MTLNEYVAIFALTVWYHILCGFMNLLSDYVVDRVWAWKKVF
jgi:hypothetical protein